MKIELRELRALIKEIVAKKVLAERGKSTHPGGPRTDIGALRQLEPNAFVLKVKAAMSSHDGDVDAAAKSLGVATRTLYHYLDDESALNDVETSSEVDDEE